MRFIIGMLVGGGLVLLLPSFGIIGTSMLIGMIIGSWATAKLTRRERRKHAAIFMR